MHTNGRDSVHVTRMPAILLIVGLMTVGATDTAAQVHRFGLGVTGGWSIPADMTPGLGSSTTLEAGPVVGGQLDAWLGTGRFGLRVGGHYGERALEEEPASSYRLLSGDLALLFRLLGPGSDAMFAPFLALGAGATQYAALEGAGPVGGGSFGEDPVVRFAAIAGAGVDVFAVRRIGVRLEVADRIKLLSVGESPTNDGWPMAHELEALATLQVRMGRRADAPMIVRATPPERTAPAQAADAAPARAEPTPAATPAQADPPAATPPAPAPARPAPDPAPAQASSAAALFTVRVGSYLDQATARSWSDRVRQHELPAWTNVSTLGGQQLAQLRVGASGSRAEADRIAAWLRAEYGWTVDVEPVADPRTVPATAIAATRAFLDRR